MIISMAKAMEAAEILEVELSHLTMEELGPAYRAKAKECHPDKHGTLQLQLWSRVSWAYETLKLWLKDRPADPPLHSDYGPATWDKTPGSCRACSGTGRIPINKSGFGKPLTMQCVMCRGNGSHEERDNNV